MIFLMCIATTQHLNYSGQEPKNHNVQLMFLDPMQNYNSAKFQNLA